MGPSPLALAERILNACVRESTAAQDILSTLSGQCLAVRIAGPEITILLQADEDELHLQPADGMEPAATVCGTPIALIASVRGNSLSGLRESGVSISGDAEVAEAFSTMLRLAKPDLEEQLSHVTGDVAAHALGSFTRRLGAWGAHALDALCANTSEYLQEEARQSPTRVEVEAFYADVEKLRDDVDRAGARMTESVPSPDEPDET